MASGQSLRRLLNNKYFILLSLMALLISLMADLLQISTVPLLLESIAVLLLAVLTLSAAYRLVCRTKSYFDKKFDEVRRAAESQRTGPAGSVEYEFTRTALVGKFKEEGLINKQGDSIQCDLTSISLKAGSLQLLGRYLVAVLSRHPDATKIAFLEGSASHFLCATYNDILTAYNRNVSLLSIRVGQANGETRYEVPSSLSSQDDVIAVVDHAADGLTIQKIADAVSERGGYMVRAIALYDDESGALGRLRQKRIRLSSLLTKSEVLRFYE